MIFLEIILLFGCIIYAAKLGGIGVGMAGGLGMAIAVFVLGLKPGAIPIDVILIILSVIFAISCMQLAGGMDYMVKLASKLLRSNPKYINILAPAVTFVLTVLGGTGYTAMSVLNVIQEVAKENHVRPSQPLTSAVIASQIAITASPISAATAAMYVVVEKMGVSFGQALAVIVPSAVFGAIVTVIISSMQGVDMDKDPIFQKRLKEGLVSMKTKKEAEKPTTRKAKVSVAIFLLAVVFIVALLLFKPYIGHTLGSRDIIIISMLMAGLVMYWFCDISLDRIKNTPIFGGGMESLVVVLGIVWMSSTIIGAHIPEIKTQATALLEQYPALLLSHSSVCPHFSLARALQPLCWLRLLPAWAWMPARFLPASSLARPSISPIFIRRQLLQLPVTTPVRSWTENGTFPGLSTTPSSFPASSVWLQQFLLVS